MKTAISLPDETFHRAAARASELGMSRSQFFATAVLHYLETLDRRSLTTRIDDALQRVGDDPDQGLAASAGRRRLDRESW